MRPILVALVALLPAVALAQSLGALTQQGYLLDASDQPVNATVPMTFAFYADSGGEGAPLWTESQEVLVSRGHYAAVLGRTTEFPDALATAPTLFLSVSVNGNELTPRLRLTSVALAWRARVAAVAEGIVDAGVTTEAMKDGAVTLAKLDPALRNEAGLLDADTLDGFDSSAFAPAAIEGKVDSIGARVGVPPDGSSVSGELAALRTTVDARATQASVDALSSTMGSRFDALGAAVGAPSSGTVVSRLDAIAQETAAVKTAVQAAHDRIGAPESASLAADVRALAAAVQTLQTTLTTYIQDRKWKALPNFYANFDQYRSEYPFTEWEWGVNYSGGTIVPVNVNGWNSGWRVTGTWAYAQGDTPSTLAMGSFTLLRHLSSTEDDTCNGQNKFLHMYTLPYTTGVVTRPGNGCVEVPLYVRRW